MSESTSGRNADDVLDESFLEIRAKLLDVAASLDRIDRAAGRLSEQQQILRTKIDRAIRLCGGDDAQRAERLQKLFSMDYDPDWRSQMRI